MFRSSGIKAPLSTQQNFYFVELSNQAAKLPLLPSTGYSIIFHRDFQGLKFKSQENARPYYGRFLGLLFKFYRSNEGL